MRGNRFFQALVFTGAVIGGFYYSDAQASSVSPSELFINDPSRVLMVDGADRHSTVSIRVKLDTPDRSAFDFGFMNNDVYIPIMGKSRKKGGDIFAGGSIVDFALRNNGADGLFGTSDDLIYRLSDNAGYAAQHYFAPIDPAQSRNPAITDSYFRDLGLNWDLNLDGTIDARTQLQIRGSRFDGMTPAPMAVSLPTTSWLLGSGLAMLGVTVRRRKRAA